MAALDAPCEKLLISLLYMLVFLLLSNDVYLPGDSASSLSDEAMDL